MVHGMVHGMCDHDSEVQCGHQLVWSVKTTQNLIDSQPKFVMARPLTKLSSEFMKLCTGPTLNSTQH